MKEDTLFNAYRNAIREDPDIEAARMEERNERMGVVKCVVHSCPTMISTHVGRHMCRYHVGKRKRGEM